MEPLRRRRYSDWTRAWTKLGSRQEIFYPPGSPEPIWSQAEVRGGFYFPRGVKRSERKANHSPHNVQVKSECNYTSIPLIRLHGVCGEHLFFSAS